MILLSFDLETTGLDLVKDRVIEVGAVLYTTTQKKCLSNFGTLVKSDVPVSAEVTKITGITQSALDRFGVPEGFAFDIIRSLMSQANAIIGHNVNNFDKPVLENWARRLQWDLDDKLWIDTMIDLPGTEGKKLTYLAADHGILNLFPHSALSDAQTVLTIVEKYDIQEVVNRAKTPTVIIQAHHQRNQNELAKKAKFRWNPEYRIWWKAVKETDINALEQSVSFPIGYASKEITLESLTAS